MKIPLTQGKFAIVDAKDYDYLMKWKWQYHDGCAIRSIQRDGQRTHLLMHRVIAKRIRNWLDLRHYVDHRDYNRLNNQRSNLRVSRTSQNMLSRLRKCFKSSGYRGVYAYKNKWRARIEVDGNEIHLGDFEVKEDAARAYNEAALKHLGEFACVNPV